MADTTPPGVSEAPLQVEGSSPQIRSSRPRKKRRFWQKHSLSIASILIVLVWTLAYRFADPNTHLGSFFGNAIADWSGVVVTVLATKWLYEKNSRESRKIPRFLGNPLWCWLREHSLSLFLILTGMAWVLAFAKMDPNSKWGQVVGNIVSEWTQIFGTVLLTKKLVEAKSKE